MKIGVTHKLFLVILIAAGLAVISCVLIMQWNLNRGFLKYVNTIEKTGVLRLADKLEELYRVEKSWESLRKSPERWRQMVFTSLPMEVPPAAERVPPPPGEMEPMAPPPEGPHGGPPEPPDGRRPRHKHGLPPPPLVRQFDQRLFLLDAGKIPVVSRLVIPNGSEMTPLRSGGKTVGYLGILPRTKLTDDNHQKRFIREQEMAFALTAGVVVALAAALSLLLATRLLRPLRELATATHKLAAGRFSVRVPYASSDELGQLAQDFNTLAVTLERNEQARRQWVADISHELRTPLAILRGEIEAIQDGVRQPTEETIQSLHAETLHLGRLVEDLHQLSLSDMGALSYRKCDLDLCEVLTEAIDAFRPDYEAKRIALEVEDGEEDEMAFFGDPERLRQLFSNLLDNALKYTDSGGKLRVMLKRHGHTITVDFRDSAPGVPPAAMDRLFERLYRVDSSRNRSTGGSGLGLAICRNIVDAHGGAISVQPSPLGGLWVRIEFPEEGNMQ